MDESGTIKGQGVNRLVVRSTRKRFIQKKQLSSYAQTLFIAYILATKKALTLLVIFKEKTV